MEESTAARDASESYLCRADAVLVRLLLPLRGVWWQVGGGTEGGGLIDAVRGERGKQERERGYVAAMEALWVKARNEHALTHCVLHWRRIKDKFRLHRRLFHTIRRALAHSAASRAFLAFAGPSAPRPLSAPRCSLGATVIRAQLLLRDAAARGRGREREG